jgi:hypothetical protein
MDERMHQLRRDCLGVGQKLEEFCASLGFYFLSFSSNGHQILFFLLAARMFETS